MTASEHSSLNRAGARVQSGGGPRTSARETGFDREKAREVLRQMYSGEELLDALEACVVQAPQTIDRDTLIAELGRFIQDDDAPDPLFSPDEVTAIAEYQAGRILALVQPVEGVLLTPEEAAYARRWLPTANSPRARALAARLEATS